MSTTHSQGRPAVRIAALAAALLALLGGGAAWGGGWWTEGRFVEDTDDAYVGGEVTVISPKVTGLIAHVAVTDNQFVRRGDLLLRLDERDYRAALARADGAVEAERAQIANLGAQRLLQQAVIAQARAGVAASDAETERARDDEQRYTRLVEQGMVSQQGAQKAHTVYSQARANGEKERASQAAAERELSVLDTRRQQAEAALAQAQAERELARLNLSYTELRAPADGYVGNRRARDGAYASPAAPLLSIVPAQGLWVDANFKESQLARIRPGQTALIEADALPGRRLRGHVTSLAPATGAQFAVLPPENATGNFTKIVQRVPVRIALDEPELAAALKPGLSVTARVDTRSR